MFPGRAFTLVAGLIGGAAAADDAPLSAVLTADQWRQVDLASGRALHWLASQQRADGSFPTLAQGQPAITSLCALAFLSCGHTPGDGPYGHYSIFYCTQAMYQLGDPYWQRFFPPLVETLLRHQRRDGSWPAESKRHDAPYGNAYTTALVVLALSTPNQLLPVLQR